MNHSIRILYANSDHDKGKYIEESIRSAKSFRKYLPEAFIELYTNTTCEVDPVFDRVQVYDFYVPKLLEKRVHKNGQMLVKIQAMINSTFEYNLYLGSDTLALSEKIKEPFKLLDKYDFALAHAPAQHTVKAEIPSCFREWNCDVIYWRKTHATREFLKEWKKLYESDFLDHPHDQGYFRYLAWKMRHLNVFTLPFLYNNRCGLYGGQGQDGEHINNSIIIQNRAVIDEITS